MSRLDFNCVWSAAASLWNLEKVYKHFNKELTNDSYVSPSNTVRSQRTSMENGLNQEVDTLPNIWNGNIYSYYKQVLSQIWVLNVNSVRMYVTSEVQNTLNFYKKERFNNFTYKGMTLKSFQQVLSF